MKTLVVIGTRPEAIKMAPLARVLSRDKALSCRVAVTGQHPDLVPPILDFFEVPVHHNMSLARSRQGLAHLHAGILDQMEAMIEQDRPDLVLVHGDTTSALAAAEAAFYSGVPVGHVEAGLRSHNLRSPWPEEMNRIAIDQLADLMFAPTEQARTNLLNEGRTDDTITVTGNTVVDALLWVCHKLDSDAALTARIVATLPRLPDDRRIILVTTHRRENFGPPLARISQALHTLANRPDVCIVFPLHPNPEVGMRMKAFLASHPFIILTHPLDYLPFVLLMRRAAVILTDSGGIQEEAPSVGTPVLVLRDLTERPEALDSGAIRLVGTRTESIVEATSEILDASSPTAPQPAGNNPFGDGKACERICQTIKNWKSPGKKRKAPA
ncbi:UDP-N-acetylglucosamine 2-epimerase (non-hydrolyzing) [Haematospirillum jordaniae]|uniref:UDP-N-acetylglucosamine 2-epimerase (non-hydrolyzing) n=2 Tax=Haematospirillum jordaniae TaxID=1549855 RepID=A0A145VSC1_9PROT|nr:UDP-N-acetylglucosamine 2-epimerase (non-hydrolyzing) [Haematospirillum jordaniae]AMW35928.1 hypothetical protein AY555_11250 [Haematospirillum jordaniae]NKD57994.1 UDP-N-acetylglucosamine 2-epimerase (non-hydrolyzing) [Haematospirillum jordaniae]NKD60074.1 UDP-N-acetylglucosamine 2-epimerase (non-hydrolyzing) [Haematospirillum jordaniae]NKD67991.1 UDP-N-acetylglucosamine 2-epimerase (non-hydrolyzing) [Haematospirillum jordaniae]NKD80084.1 UDP-N-acetylglucosamine 2-epimerase (non-hydrolyzin